MRKKKHVFRSKAKFETRGNAWGLRTSTKKTETEHAAFAKKRAPVRGVWKTKNEEFGRGGHTEGGVTKSKRWGLGGRTRGRKKKCGGHLVLFWGQGGGPQ